MKTKNLIALLGFVFLVGNSGCATLRNAGGDTYDFLKGDLPAVREDVKKYVNKEVEKTKEFPGKFVKGAGELLNLDYMFEDR